MAGIRRIAPFCLLLALGSVWSCREEPSGGTEVSAARLPTLPDLQGCYTLELGPWFPPDERSELEALAYGPYALPSRLVLAPALASSPIAYPLRTISVAWDGRRKTRSMMGEIEGDSLVLRASGVMLSLNVMWDTLEGVARIWGPADPDGIESPYRHARLVGIDCQTREPIRARRSSSTPRR